MMDGMLKTGLCPHFLSFFFSIIQKKRKKKSLLSFQFWLKACLELEISKPSNQVESTAAKARQCFIYFIFFGNKSWAQIGWEQFRFFFFFLFSPLMKKTISGSARWVKVSVIYSVTGPFLKYSSVSSGNKVFHYHLRSLHISELATTL